MVRVQPATSPAAILPVLSNTSSPACLHSLFSEQLAGFPQSVGRPEQKEDNERNFKSLFALSSPALSGEVDSAGAPLPFSTALPLPHLEGSVHSAISKVLPEVKYKNGTGAVWDPATALTTLKITF